MCIRDRTEHGVQRAKYQCGKKQDTDADSEGAQQGIHVYRLGTCHRLPYAYGNIKEGTQPGKPLAHVHHVLAEGEHIFIQGSQYGMQVGKIYRQRYHGLPVFGGFISIEPHHTFHIVLFPGTEIAHGYVLVSIIAHQIAVTAHFVITVVHHIHTVLVGHGERAHVDDLFEVLQHAVALLQQAGVTEGDGVQLAGREVVVVHHLFEVRHIDVGHIAYHQDDVTHLAGVLYPVSYTHLDVYKRQYIFPVNIPVATFQFLNQSAFGYLPVSNQTVTAHIKT